MKLDESQALFLHKFIFGSQSEKTKKYFLEVMFVEQVKKNG